MRVNKLIILILLFASSCGITKNVNSKQIFRYIDLNDNERIELGDNLKSKNHLINKINESYFLKKKTFGGAESIQLIANNKGKISEIVFEYNERISKQMQIENYKQDFGEPIIKSGKAIWSDGNTKFSIYDEKLKGRTITYSRIINLIK